MHTKWHQIFRQLRWGDRREFQLDVKNSLNRDLEQVQKHREENDPKHATLEKLHHMQYVRKIFGMVTFGALDCFSLDSFLLGMRYSFFILEHFHFR